MLRDYYLKVKLIKRTPRKEIWLVKNTLDGQLCIAKLQSSAFTEASKKSNVRNVLHQGKFLQSTQGYPGIPSLHWAGKDESIGLSMIICQRLGLTVEDLYRDQGGKFSLKTVCQLGISIFNIIRCYHDKGYVHGNIKPSTLQFGVGHKSTTLYLNDFMESKHVKKQLMKSKITPHQFMSFDRMQGYQACRRDDIESTILMLIYLFKGSLPWTGMFEKLETSHNEFSELEGDSISFQKDLSISKEQTKQETLKFNKKSILSQEKKTQQLHRVLVKIDEITIDQICAGVRIEFTRMLQQCRRLQFESRPDYNYYIHSLRRIMLQSNIIQDGRYDWMVNNKRLAVKREFNIEEMLLQFPKEQELLEKLYYPFEKRVELS